MIKKAASPPTMVVDKSPTELSNFPALVKEADRVNKVWDFVSISSLSGVNNSAHEQ